MDKSEYWLEKESRKQTKINKEIEKKNRIFRKMAFEALLRGAQKRTGEDKITIPASED